MALKRVVVTGMGAVSPFGRGIDALRDGLLENRSAITKISDLHQIKGLRCHVAGLVTGIDPKEIPRKFRRTMSKMSVYATLAAQDALNDAGVSLDYCSQGRLGLVIGSTTGSVHTIQNFFEDFLKDYSLERIKSTLFFQIMGHSCAANVAQTLGITGPILAPSAACSTGCQAVGYGYEMIRTGQEEMMLCGGADEFHPLTAATFDIMNAASTHFNDEPFKTPRPFDLKRDGVVCSEGSGVLFLESLDSARKRKTKIYAEILGFATNSDVSNIANPDPGSLELCMRKALLNSGLQPEQIDYINVHATGTIQGDAAEAKAIQNIFANSVAVSSLKGHLGHTMAASGALELIATILMLEQKKIIGTLNLEEVDPECAKINHIGEIEEYPLTIALKNNFALGGVNSTVILRRYKDD